VREASPPIAADRARLKREVLTLVGLVLIVDVAFVGIYFAAGVGRASGDLKLGYAVVWTGVTLAVALRSLGRIRSARVRLRRGPRP